MTDETKLEGQMPAEAEPTITPAPGADGAAVQGKRKLKLAGADAKRTSGKVKAKLVTAAVGSGLATSANMAGRPAGLMALKSVFVAVVIIMTVLSAVDISLAARRIASDQRPAPDIKQDLPRSDQDAFTPPDLAEVLAQFAKVPLFGDAGSGPGPIPPPPVEGWQDYVRENVSFIGLTPVGNNEYEAIIVDKKTDKMHLVRLGQSVEMSQQSLTLDQVSKDEVVLTDGTAKQIIEPQPASGGI